MKNLCPPHAKFTPLLSILAVCACSYTMSAQTAWTGTTSVFWNTSTNWSNGIPTSSTDIVQTTTPATTATINGGLAATAQSLNYSATSGTWEITGAGTGSQLTLSGDLTKSGASSLNIRKESAGALSLTVNGNILLSAGNLALGTSNGNYLAALTVSGTTTVSGGNLNIGVATDYSMGALQVNGGTVNLNQRAASAGTRQVTIAGLTGTAGVVRSGTITGNAVNLIINTASGTSSSGTTLQDGAVAGSVLSVEKTGTGMQTLSSANTYSGGTTVSNGKLAITNATNSLGTGLISVSGGIAATLGGTGVATSAVTVTNGSRLAAGTITTANNFGSAGTLTLATTLATTQLTLTNANLDFDLATTAAGTSDKIVAGSLTLGSTIAFNFTGLGATLQTGVAYTLIDGNSSGSVTGFSAGNISTTFLGTLSGNYSATYSVGGTNDLLVTFAAIPEPSTWSAILGGLGILVGAQTWRRRKMD